MPGVRAVDPRGAVRQSRVTDNGGSGDRAFMRSSRQRHPGILIGVYAFVAVCVLVGAPTVTVADILFGTTTAECVFIGVLLVALWLGHVAWRGASKLRLERDRRSSGLCPGCGYDVRANPTRCPECGRLILP